jgi:hypothetical protein
MKVWLLMLACLPVQCFAGSSNASSMQQRNAAESACSVCRVIGSADSNLCVRGQCASHGSSGCM